MADSVNTGWDELPATEAGWEPADAEHALATAPPPPCASFTPSAPRSPACGNCPYPRDSHAPDARQTRRIRGVIIA